MSALTKYTTIPPHEQESFISSFWAMLQGQESLADSTGNPVLRHEVESLYRQWNRVTGDQHQPAWIVRKANNINKTVTSLLAQSNPEEAFQQWKTQNQQQGTSEETIAEVESGLNRALRG